MSKIDRRKLKSRKAIHSTFLEMLSEVGFDDITVKNITEKADLGRKTFYLHYVDKYELLDKIVAEHLAQLAEICIQKENKGFIEGTIIWFDYLEKHKSFFAPLFSSNSTLSFRKKLLSFIISEVEKKLDTSKSINQNMDKDVILKFLGTAILGIMESYVLEEFDDNTEYVAKQVGELLQRNL